MNELFHEIEPFDSGYMDVSGGHRIYYEQAGNPKGAPILFLHGGPGAGLSPSNRRFFDPNFYRVILFDQRGCGKSLPHAELKNNNTWEILSDIELLRKKLGIEKWVVFGGSWGSTLALIYAINYSERVLGLILRGIWLSRKEELHWLYQEGASKFFPEYWEKYTSVIPEDKRNNYLKSYYDIFIGDDHEKAVEAAEAWSVWEASISKLIQSKELIETFGDADFAIAISKIETHYFVNNLFMNSDNYIMENIDKIKFIPTLIVNGRYDLICPVTTAMELEETLDNAELVIVPDAGHSSMETGTISTLVSFTEQFKSLY